MRGLLFVFGLAAMGAGVYLAGQRGVSDAAALATAGAGVFALVMFKLGAGGQKTLRPAVRGLMQHSPSERKEANELSESLEGLIAAREARNAEALDGRNTVAVYLSGVGDNQIAVIKVLRQHFNLQLKEAKDLSDAAKRGQKPSLGQSIPTAAARALERDITRAGGDLEIR